MALAIPRKGPRFWRRVLGPYLVLMLLTSLVPMAADSPTPGFLLKLDPGIQNLLHVPMFAILLWVLFAAYELRFAKEMRVPLVLAIAGAIAYCGLLEAVQILVPGRYASLDDVLFNALGVGLGVLCRLLPV